MNNILHNTAITNVIKFLEKCFSQYVIPTVQEHDNESKNIIQFELPEITMEFTDIELEIKDITLDFVEIPLPAIAA